MYFTKASIAAIAIFLVIKLVANVAWIEYFDHRYPRHNSMAGLEAFIFSSFFAVPLALFAFLLILGRYKSKSAVKEWQERDR